MNERIKELREQAFDWVQYQLQTVGSNHPVMQNEQLQMVNEKFAELIVRECVNRVRSRQMFAIEDDQNVNHAFDLLIYDIESHFGVKE